jgi:hypothetical protein
LDTNVSEDHAASIFRVEVHDKWKMGIDRQGMGKVGYNVSQQKMYEENSLNRT